MLGQIDAAALDGLRRDGLLRSSLDDPFSIGPEFAHDELRRYAIARLLLVGRGPRREAPARGRAALDARGGPGSHAKRCWRNRTPPACR